MSTFPVRVSRWINRNLPKREELEHNRWIGPLARRHELWRFTRRSVPRGVAVGLLTQAWLVEISIAVALSFVVSALVNGRGHLMVEKIGSIPGLRCRKPDGAFYVFADVTGLFGKRWREGILENDLDTAAFFLKEAHVAVVPGTAFRRNGYVRFVFANSEADIVNGLDRIADAIASELKG